MPTHTSFVIIGLNLFFSPRMIHYRAVIYGGRAAEGGTITPKYNSARRARVWKSVPSLFARRIFEPEPINLSRRPPAKGSTAARGGRRRLCRNELLFASAIEICTVMRSERAPRIGRLVYDFNFDDFYSARLALHATRAAPLPPDAVTTPRARAE